MSALIMPRMPGSSPEKKRDFCPSFGTNRTAHTFQIAETENIETVMFEKNVGSVDQVIRVIVGIGIIGVGIYFQSWWGLIGIVPILTAVFGRCGMYVPFGLNTCKMKTNAAAKSR